LVSESSRSPSPSSFLHSPLTPPQQQQDEMALLDATKSKLIQNSLRSHRRYEFHVEESLSAKGSVDVEESLSDFKHLTAAAQRQEGQPRQESYSVDRTFDSTKRLIDQALERNEDSLHEFLLNDQLSHSHLSSLSTLSPRDGHIHFRKIQKRMKEVRCCSCCLLGSTPPPPISGPEDCGGATLPPPQVCPLPCLLSPDPARWFVSILSDIKRCGALLPCPLFLIIISQPNPPPFLLSLLAATASYLSVGKELNPAIFFPLIGNPPSLSPLIMCQRQLSSLLPTTSTPSPTRSSLRSEKTPG
jgi:hypothetical protein